MKGVIYQIINTENGKKYIGSTKNDPRIRKKRHFRELENENHHNIILQRAWNKYGEECFKFQIIEKVENALRKREKELIPEGEYNISADACGGNLIKNHPNKEQIEEKKERVLREWINNLSKEQRKQKFGRKKEKNGNWQDGKTKKKMTCECGNKKAWYADKCRECYDKSGENNPFYGKSHSEETKKELSEQRKGEYNGSQNKPVTDGKQTYSSLGNAAQSEDVSVGAIHNRVNSKTFPNWKYVKC